MTSKRRTQAEMAAYRSAIVDAVEALRPWWPVTLRTVWYQLVAALVVENILSRYKQLSSDLTNLRESGQVPWEALEDRSRSILGTSGWINRDGFAEAEVRYFLTGYRRDLLQSQPRRLEWWIEKDALSHIVADALAPFGIRVVVAKGFSSSTFGQALRERVVRHRTVFGQPTCILFSGDLDPSGWEIPQALERVARRNGIGEEDLTVKRVALNRDRADSLPSDPETGIKPSDSRTPAFLREVYGVEVPESVLAMPQGTDAERSDYRAALMPYCRQGRGVELDAVPPGELQALAVAAVEAELDLSAYQWELAIQAEERDWLAAKRRDVAAALTL